VGQQDILEYLRKRDGQEFDAQHLRKALRVNLNNITRCVNQMIKYNEIGFRWVRARRSTGQIKRVFCYGKVKDILNNRQFNKYG